LAHTTTGCGKQGFPSAQPYLSHTPGANPFCCMFLVSIHFCFPNVSKTERDCSSHQHNQQNSPNPKQLHNKHPYQESPSIRRELRLRLGLWPNTLL
ncbi:hypothetical protein BP00DRAFT_335212, partial [Aspergillus indologenus CBS 114.80]